MMKVWIVVFFNIILITNLYAQKDSKFFFNEFSVSINYTTLKDDNTEDRIGFGIGVYRLFLKKENAKSHFVMGFEFNNTSQLKYFMYGGNNYSSSNVIYDLNYISIPLLLRIKLYSSSIIFIEPGLFFEFLVSSNQSGLSTLNYGPSFGSGFKAPIIKGHDLIFKIDYKIGLKYIYESMDNVKNQYIRFMIAYKI